MLNHGVILSIVSFIRLIRNTSIICGRFVTGYTTSAGIISISGCALKRWKVMCMLVESLAAKAGYCIWLFRGKGGSVPLALLIGG